MGKIDESLYSRQLYVLGKDAMERMMNSKVLIIGMNGLGTEICKNLCLTGIQQIYTYDDKQVTIDDLGTGFYFSESDVGKNRTCCIEKLRELNGYVRIEITDEIIYDVTLMISCDDSIERQKYLGEECRNNGVFFIGCQQRGLSGYVFCDFLKDFVVLDDNGEEPVTGILDFVNKEGVCVSMFETRHELETGMAIKIRHPDYENQYFQVKVITPYKFRILRLENLEDVPLKIQDNFKEAIGCHFEQVKIPKRINFRKMADAIRNNLIIGDNIDFQINLQNCYIALGAFHDKHLRYPRYENQVDYEEFLKFYPVELEESNKEFVKKFINISEANFMPVTSIVGGFASQEALKAISSKFTPINQLLYLDFSDILPNDCSETVVNENSRYNFLNYLFGDNYAEKLYNSEIFLIGAGAIGCEHLKNFAMLGMGIKGSINITDMDTIENSNLNRQFLFKKSDIGSLKSEIAAREAKKINPDLKINCYNLKVEPETEDIFNEEFMTKQTLIANALDNVESRLYVDDRCILFRKAFFDSGTLGTKGNSQPIIPFLTESYASSTDPPEKSIPVCTVRNFPLNINHSIEWALSEFEEIFQNIPTYIQNYINSKEKDDDKKIDENNITVDAYKKAPRDINSVIKMSILLFVELFHTKVKDILSTFPADYVTPEGIDFWGPPRKPPEPISFDINNPLHLLFVVSTSNLLKYVYNLKGNIIENDIVNFYNNEMMFDQNEKLNLENKTELKKLNPPKSDKNDSSENSELKRVNPIKFDKDDPTEHHINFIYSATNLRAENYKIRKEDKLKIKGIAGKIIPAISTTTSVISGLSVIEMIKYIFKLKNYKNSFINLALPFIAFSDPLPPKIETYTFDKIKYEYTLWDQFELKDLSITELINYFKKHNKTITMITYGNEVLYSDFYNFKKIDPNKKLSELYPNIKILKLDVLFENEDDDVSYPTVVLYM